MTAQELLGTIKPGKNYPSFVKITEPWPPAKIAGTEVQGKMTEVRFNLCSYVVGMYAAIYFPGQSQPVQTGDHNNKSFVTKLKKDIQRAIKRGATVEISGIRPVKTEM